MPLFFAGIAENFGFFAETDRGSKIAMRGIATKRLSAVGRCVLIDRMPRYDELLSKHIFCGQDKLNIVP